MNNKDALSEEEFYISRSMAVLACKKLSYIKKEFGCCLLKKMQKDKQ